MLNVEKIRLMTQLSIYDKKEGKAIRDVSRYFKGDYLSRRIFMALVHYSLCFILVSMLLVLINLENFLMHINIPFLVAAVRVLLFIYVAGLVGMMIFSYARYARAYDDLHRKSLYYMAKLDKLLQLEEAPDTKLDIESAGSEFYKDKGGTIRIMDEKRRDDPREPEGGWLDDPIEPADGWLDDGDDTVNTEDEGDWLDDPIEQSKKSSQTKKPSSDGIQLMNFRNNHEGR